MIPLIKKQALFFLVYLALYVLAYGALFLNTGLFQDDWVWWPGEADTLSRLRQLGRPLLGLMLRASFFTDGLMGHALSSARVFTFLAFLTSGWLVFRVLEKGNLLSGPDAFLAGLLSALAPVNTARAIACNLHYSFSYLCFCLGCFFLVTFMDRKKPAWRLVALFLFAMALLTESFLALYLLVLLFLAFYSSKKKQSQGVLRTLLRYPDFLVLPLFVLMARLVFFKSQGLYEGYNAVTLKGLVKGFSSLPAMVEYGLFNLFSLPWKDADRFPIAWVYGLGLGLLFFGARIMGKGDYFSSANPGPRSLGAKARDILLAVFFIFLALYPYGVVNKIPNLFWGFNWASRFQLTLGLVLGPAMVLVFRAVFPHRGRWVVLACLAAYFTAVNAASHTALLKNSHVQQALMITMQEEPAFEECPTFFFDDRFIPGPRAVCWWYEVSGMMRRAFGEGSRMGLLCSRHSNLMRGLEDPRGWQEEMAWAGRNYGRFPGYGHAGHEPGEKVCLVRLREGKKDLTGTAALSLSLLRIRDGKAYARRAPGYLGVETRVLKNENFDGFGPRKTASD